MNKCEKCGTEFEGNFCPECGTRHLRERTCPRCGEIAPEHAKFCINCGFSFENGAPARLPKEVSAVPSESPQEVPPAPARAKSNVYRGLTHIPPILFLLYSLLMFGFMGASVFGGEYSGIRDGYLIIMSDSTLRNYFVAIVALMSAGVMVAVGYVVAHFCKNGESEDYGTVTAILLLLGQVILSSIIIGEINNIGAMSNASGTNGTNIYFPTVTPGACPILILVFSLAVFLGIAVIYIVAGFFYRKTPASYAVSPNGYALFEKEVTTVAPFAFEGRNDLVKANVPEGIAEIGDNAFSRCAGLNWVSLPASLSRIGDYAFYGCGDLHDIVYAGTSSDWEAVDKGSGWDLATHGLTVHCLDKKIIP